MALFRVELNQKCEKPQLGFQWIEVLAIEPFALGNPAKEDWGEWCYKVISSMYICRTDSGLHRISSEDFWYAIEENAEYTLSE